MTIIYDRIPKEKFGIFHAVLCDTGGRYLLNPRASSDTVWVFYTPGEGAEEAYRRRSTPIVEVFKNQKWRIVLRRLRGIISQFRLWSWPTHERPSFSPPPLPPLRRWWSRKNSNARLTPAAPVLSMVVATSRLIIVPSSFRFSRFDRRFIRKNSDAKSKVA